MRTEKARQKQGLLLKIAITWLCIFLLIGFCLAGKEASGTTTMSVLPEVPRTGEPVVLTFNLNNLTAEPSTTSYELFRNGQLLQSGEATIAAQTSAQYQYAYSNPLATGEQANFALRTSSAEGDAQKVVSLPAYPPQLMSSFVSFAAFSTSVMSSMIATEYFDSVFGEDNRINTGIIVAAVLISLLIFLELTQTFIVKSRRRTLASYRTSFSTVSAVLFSIFVGMVFTKVVMIITV